MIPIKLQIKNFLSYGSDLQEIDFGSYNLICLSGKNGHGKSALLDAMTWAIWGEARKTTGTSKADHGLLRLGQRHMIVIFDFVFNKNKYRVRREFTFAYGKPYALLEFGMFENEEKITPLTDKTIRATQDKIATMIGLNYESFVNSAFLKQGSSNEFSKKSPKERKEILADILDLNKYEQMRKIALDKIKQKQIEKDGIFKIQGHIEKEINNYEEVKINLLNTQQELNKISEIENKLLNEKLNLEKEKKIFFLRLQDYKLIDIQLKKIQEDKNKKIEKLKSIYFQWKSAHRQLINFPDIKELEEKKQKLVLLIQDYQKKLEKKLNLKELYLKYKEQEQILAKELSNKKNLIIQEKNLELERLLNNNENIKEKLQELLKNKKQLNDEFEDLKLEISKIEKSILLIDENLFFKIEKQLEKRKNFYQQMIAKGNLLKNELINLNQKNKFSLQDNNPSCPLCEQNLSISRKKFLKIQFFKQEKFINHKLKRISTLILKLKELLLMQHEEIKSQKKVMEQNKLYQLKLKDLEIVFEKNSNQIKQLENQEKEFVKDLVNLEKNIAEKKLQLIEIQKQDFLNVNEDYKKFNLLINETSEKISDLKYDADSHNVTLQELNNIETNLIISNNRNQIIKEQLQRKSEIFQFCASIKSIKKEIKKLEAEILNFNNLFDHENELISKEKEIIITINKLMQNKENLLQQNGSFENQKIKIEQLIEEYKKQKNLIARLDESIEEYKTISVALSKEGIQAILIEDAIPEIESECNELLSKLTDNQSQIIIESLRDLKKGGTKETLDIKISDGAGIRPYEMFSGGEAFRIDFALRIAISKLLARRAGTSLQTLIIDEGFGSQDEEGLSNIMDSIYKIQNDFAKIIVVSHLPSMKDQFPVHFFVEKSPSGSKVKIIEQG